MPTPSLPALASLGWSDWFAARAAPAAGEALAREAAVDRDQLLLLDGAGAFRARLAGRFLHRHDASAHPCVGDWVCVERTGEGGPALIQGVVPRRTVLRRRAADGVAVAQVIAANVDVVVVLQAADHDFNLKRLERYLVMAAEGGAEALVLLTKADLVAPETVAAQDAAIRAAGITAPVLRLSNVSRAGVAELEARLEAGRTYCFVGSSGVGKSTLINHLLGRTAQATAMVSGTGEGRHTTVRRELLVLARGALVIDTPGMRELGMLGGEHGLAAGFTDIAAAARECRFRDCSHRTEPGCAVRALAERGLVDPAQLEHFHKLSAEAAFHDQSVAERRQQARAFGKLKHAAQRDLERDP